MRLKYDSKKNKETKVANELNSRIIRTEALRESIQSQYDNDINKLKEKIARKVYVNYRFKMYH